MALLIIAHRGSSGEYPENTLSAFEAAVRDGADWCELDVQLSRDGRLVVIHDATVDRTTDGHGAVAELTMAELKTLDAARRFDGKSSAKFIGERLPELDQVFDAVGGCSGLNIELKAKGTGRAVADLIKRRDAYGSAMVSSFDRDELATVASIDPAIRLGVLGERDPASMFETARRLDAWSVNPRFDLATAEFCAEAHRRGLRVLTWTVDAADLMRQLAANGVDGIMTNYPGRLHNLVRNLERAS